jgi:hypothetical protein
MILLRKKRYSEEKDAEISIQVKKLYKFGGKWLFVIIID